VLAAGGCVALLFALLPTSADKVIVRFGDLTWNRRDFCRGWLITGDTGTGKTKRALNSLMYQIFENEPNWGGLCIDDKNNYKHTLLEMARHFGREDDVLLLEVRPDGAGSSWKPKHTYNLTSDRSLPWETYGKMVVDAASALGVAGDKGFFRAQVETHVPKALEALYETGFDVDLEDALNVLKNPSDLQKVLDALESGTPTERRARLIEHFSESFLNQPPEQKGGVVSSIENYLKFLLTPDIAEVFCRGNTFEFSDIERGKIICVSMPQKYQAARRWVNTFMKLLFYTHVLRRFDQPPEARGNQNLLILWKDEAQRFATAAEDGMSDYNCVDVMREAQATVIAAAQSFTSFVPPFGADKAKVYALNLRNRIAFRAADIDGAKETADFIGQRTVTKRSWGHTQGRATSSYHRTEEFKIKPHQLMELSDGQAVVVHCSKRWQKMKIPARNPDGTTGFKRPSVPSVQPATANS
jgi:hypothetical protein